MFPLFYSQKAIKTLELNLLFCASYKLGVMFLSSEHICCMAHSVWFCPFLGCHFRSPRDFLNSNMELSHTEDHVVTIVYFSTILR